MNRDEIEAANQRVIEAGAFVQPLLSEAGKVIVGQSYLMERLVISLLANGHVLLEGVPGLAKTLAIKTLADTLNANFSRIQFTPDMLPADVTGTQIYNPQSGEFTTRQGPVFANLVLADEINRAPAKVQSALLEAMQEKQVTIGATTYPLPSPFLVLATENPIEQEGTYPLPEAQVDRFMLKVVISYPERDEERDALGIRLAPVRLEPVPDLARHERRAVRRRHAPRRAEQAPEQGRRLRGAHPRFSPTRVGTRREV